MKRHTVAPRHNWIDIAQQQNFIFASQNGKPYWNESAYYSFNLEQIENDLESPSAELYALLLDMVDQVVGSEQALILCGIPPAAWDPIQASWKQRDPSLYGRFDLAYSGNDPAKLIEFNGDTPTSIYEAAYFQWQWLTDRIQAGVLPRDTDQFSSIHEALITGFQRLVEGRLSLTSFVSEEDCATISYLGHCATEAGRTIELVDIETIRLDDAGRLSNAQGQAFETLFKLYPWEWIFAESLAPAFHDRSIRFLEPAWKLVASSKGLLPLLWAAHPGHPNLLEAYFESDPRHARLTDFASKPVFSREGANTRISRGGCVHEAAGPFAAQPRIRQAFTPLFTDGSSHAVLGSWIVDGRPCGLGIRESSGLITDDQACFVPHIIQD